MTDARRQAVICLDRMGLLLPAAANADLRLVSPIDAQLLMELRTTTQADMTASLEAVQRTQRAWAALPPPRRGQLLRQFANRLRMHRTALAQLVTMETGKVSAEAIGEVQAMVEACDFGADLSHELHGLAIAPERPEHEMFESWHPIGICGVISSFSSPVAVWAWNAVLALVCGNGLVWKPSEKTPLSAFAAHGLLHAVLAETEPDFIDIAQLCLGGRAQGAWLVEHPAVRLISATGSTETGRAVAVRCAAQLKRGIFELGGNSAAIVRPSADLTLTTRAIVSAALATSGQRRTTLRRAFIHSSIYEELVERLKAAFADLSIGHPAEPGTQMGPLIDDEAYRAMAAVLADCAQRGNRITGGDRLNADLLPRAYYVRPALVETETQHDAMLTETLAPILYLQRVDDLDRAIALNNAAAHGSSSCIFTNAPAEADRFVSASGSTSAIANVNIGTTGAENGSAVDDGTEHTGRRKVGRDDWKGFMRRVTHTCAVGAVQRGGDLSA